MSMFMFVCVLQDRQCYGAQGHHSSRGLSCWTATVPPSRQEHLVTRQNCQARMQGAGTGFTHLNAHTHTHTGRRSRDIFELWQRIMCHEVVQIKKSGLMSVSFSSVYIYFVFILPAFIVYMLYRTIILNNYNAIYMQLLFLTFSTEGMKRKHKHKQGF